MSEDDINFDILQREINDAEKVLTRSLQFISSGDSQVQATKIPPQRRSLDDRKRNDILQQLGRRPIGTTSTNERSSSIASPVPPSASTTTNTKGSSDLGNFSDANDVGSTSIRPSRSSQQKYTDPAEREKLISRLLVCDRHVNNVYNNI